MRGQYENPGTDTPNKQAQLEGEALRGDCRLNMMVRRTSLHMLAGARASAKDARCRAHVSARCYGMRGVALAEVEPCSQDAEARGAGGEVMILSSIVGVRKLGVSGVGGADSGFESAGGTTSMKMKITIV